MEIGIPQFITAYTVHMAMYCDFCYINLLYAGL